MKRANASFDTSSNFDDADAQVAIRRWLIFSILKNAFGGSSDTTLSRLRELLHTAGPTTPFPADDLYRSLEIEPRLNDDELDRIFSYGYQGRYTYLILSLLYPDRDWKDAVFHEDHIYPQSNFQVRSLRKRGYDDLRIEAYLSKYNALTNLQLLTDSENLSKNAKLFEEWIQTRDGAFRKRHLIPDLSSYEMDSFEDFVAGRAALIKERLQAL
jgi:hypothetical protein